MTETFADYWQFWGILVKYVHTYFVVITKSMLVICWKCQFDTVFIQKYLKNKYEFKSFFVFSNLGFYLCASEHIWNHAGTNIRFPFLSIFKNLGEECEFSSVSGTLRMLYHDQVYQYVINEHEYFSHVFQGKWYEGCVTFRICTQEFLRWVHQLNF